MGVVSGNLRIVPSMGPHRCTRGKRLCKRPNRNLLTLIITEHLGGVALTELFSHIEVVDHTLV